MRGDYSLNIVKWLVYTALNIPVMLISYLLNPIVILFCDEDGELPWPLHLFQTWDDSCDSYYFMTEVVPSWLDYGYDEHYIHSTAELPLQYNRTRDVSICKKSLTIIERVQRYFCRLWWLTRNCGYGFAFYWFGTDVVGADITVITDAGDVFVASTEDAWTYQRSNTICNLGKHYRLVWDVFLGWKFFAEPPTMTAKRCSIAQRALIKIDER